MTIPPNLKENTVTQIHAVPDIQVKSSECCPAIRHTEQLRRQNH